MSKGLNPTRSITTALPATRSPRTIREFPAELKIPCLSSLGNGEEDEDEELAPAQNMRSADSRRRLSLFFEFGGSIGDVGDPDELLPPRKSQKVRAASTATARMQIP